MGPAAIVAAIVVYATCFFPALDWLSDRAGMTPAVLHAAPLEEEMQHTDRPNLHRCYFDLISWREDSFCVTHGGYALVWSEACSEQAACYEKFILNQQRCVDRPKTCYRFLKEPGGAH